VVYEIEHPSKESPAEMVRNADSSRSHRSAIGGQWTAKSFRSSSEGTRGARSPGARSPSATQ
jgi:hypothetical protein